MTGPVTSWTSRSSRYDSGHNITMQPVWRVAGSPCACALRSTKRARQDLPASAGIRLGVPRLRLLGFSIPATLALVSSLATTTATVSDAPGRVRVALGRHRGECDTTGITLQYHAGQRRSCGAKYSTQQSRRSFWGCRVALACRCPMATSTVFCECGEVRALQALLKFRTRTVRT